MSSQFEHLLHTAVAPWLDLPQTVVDVLEVHYALFVKWNRVLNLSKVVELEDAVRKHYAESLFLAVCCPSQPRTVADIGSGPGFPGIPLAALWPDRTVTLVESDTRKAAFLRECRDFVPNLRVECVRAEHLGVSFDAVVSRAVRPADVVRVARRCAGAVGLLLSEIDSRSLKVPNASVTPLPGGGGVALWADVPRETTQSRG